MVAAVGLFNYPVRVYSPDFSRSEELNPLVDTGSVFTWIPATVLERLDIVPLQEWPFQLAKRQIITRPIADATLEIDGARAVTVVIFGQPSDHVLLGAHTLERFLLMPDLVNKRLVPVVGIVA